jgi:hypothetical protein
MGLDILLGWPGQTAEERSALMAGEAADGKVGYLRSDYNESGFNRWADCQLGGRDWYWIFDYADSKLQVVGKAESGEDLLGFTPDWPACRLRAEEALKIARQIDDGLFLIPLPRPFGKPETFPTECEMLDVYQAEREDLTRQWANFAGGKGPPLKTKHGRFAANWVKIQAVLWSQHPVYHSGAPATIDLQPVLVCEGPPDIHEGYISALEATLRLIDFGQEKNGWLIWSG